MRRREILRCPQCRGELRDAEGPRGPELVCTSSACGLAYRVDDGIPVQRAVEAPRLHFEAGAVQAEPGIDEDGLDLLASRGAKLVEVDLHHSKFATPVYYLVSTAEARSNLAR